mgnify:CR=1 FL=1
MEESLALWEEISNSQWFAKTAFILFLNKLDLFKAKIRKVDMKVTFPDYTGLRAGSGLDVITSSSSSS